MAKRKYPSELNTRTVRVNIGDWQLLMEISRHAGIAVAEAFHKLVIMHQPQPEKRPEQIPVSSVFFKPKSVSSDGAVRIKLKSIK